MLTHFTRYSRCDAVALLLVLTLASMPSMAATFSAGPGATCTHTTPQAALDAAAANPGPDVVRIVRSATWTAQQISTTTDQDVEIIGGYLACTSAAPDGKTTLSGAGGNARSVIALRGNGVFRLSRLVIRDGDQAGDDDGGGIHFLGGGIVEIRDSDITENEAEDGGGIYAQGTTTAAEFVIGANVVVTNNVARRHGGGALAQNIEMSMIAPGSLLGFNTAGSHGGGLLVASGEFPSYAYIGSSGIGGLGAVYGNQAAIGGGIGVLSGVDSQRTAEVQVFSTTPDAPVRVAGNNATVRGGGIDLQPDADGLDGDAPAIAKLRHVSIEDNTAPVGAAMHLANDDAGPPGLVTYTGGVVYFNQSVSMNPAAAPCPFGAPCGYIVRNRTLNSTGAVVQISNGSDWAGSRIAIEDNEGGWLMYLDGDYFTTLDLDNAVIAGNTMQNSLIRDDDYSDFVPMELHYLTIVGNAIGAASVLSINDDLNLTRSIVDQPGKSLLAPGGSGTQTVLYTMMPGATGSGIVNAAPRLVDPANGDYLPRAGSTAVDAAPPLPAFTQDLHSHTRTIDLPLNPDESGGASDLGALEREYLQPLVLNANFDEDLTLWAAEATSSWDGSQDAGGNPGSGSARVPMPTIIDGKRAKLVGGLSQCIHLPGPGTYELNGAARVVPSSNPPFGSNRAGLAWELRYNDGDFGCQNGAPDQIGAHPIATTSTWTRPATAATITIPPGRWTRNTSLTVIADVQGAPANPPTGWFDDVTLAPGVPALPAEVFSDGFE